MTDDVAAGGPARGRAEQKSDGDGAGAAAGAYLDSVRIVLVETSHPGNIGAAARAMKVMGLTRLCLVRPARFPSADATARAAGADDILAGATICDSLADAIAECSAVIGTSARERAIAWPSAAPRECAQLALAPGQGDVAFVFGRENSGLSNAELDLCNLLLTIPTSTTFRSLNLAAAVQIVGYELRMALDQAQVPARPGSSRAGREPDWAGAGARSGAPACVEPEAGRDPPASAADLEGLFGHLERALIHCGYLDPNAPRLLMRRLRRLFGRSAMRRSELNILRGILASVESMQPRVRHGPAGPAAPSAKDAAGK